MEDKSKLLFYDCKYNSDLGIPITIITCNASSTFEKYFSEYFLFFPQKKDFIGCQISSKEYIIDYLKIDFDFMLDEAKVAAQNKIYTYLYEQNIGNKDTRYLLYDVTLRETNLFNFVQLINSKKFEREINSIRNKTKCNQLKDLIDKILDSESEYDITFRDFRVE
jgi:hypothetical protein